MGATTTTDWVNEKKPPVKIAYDVENQNFTFEGDGSIIGPSQSSKFSLFQYLVLQLQLIVLV